MEARELKVGDVVRISPESESLPNHKIFAGCLMIVTDSKDGWAQGGVLVPGKGISFYQCRFENMEYVGNVF